MNRPPDPRPDKRTRPEPPGRIPVILIGFLLASIAGFGIYSYSRSSQTLPTPAPVRALVPESRTVPDTPDTVLNKSEAQPKTTSATATAPSRDLAGAPPGSLPETHGPSPSLPGQGVRPRTLSTKGQAALPRHRNEKTAPKDLEGTRDKIDTSLSTTTPGCFQATTQLDTFYSHLDQQPYMAAYKLPTSSRQHFTALIQKLLANPPQVTRESDDLYTILKNTAHFFRVSGKDNIQMMKGILDNEKGSIEQILANYFLLVSDQECQKSPYAKAIAHGAPYEYACFFLNTMGGRLYLFRRDSLSRMVVTYYAILLVDQANREDNNRHGIALGPTIDSLIAEMEAGGSALRRTESYLDKLYDLKERYQ